MRWCKTLWDCWSWMDPSIGVGIEQKWRSEKWTMNDTDEAMNEFHRVLTWPIWMTCSDNLTFFISPFVVWCTLWIDFPEKQERNKWWMIEWNVAGYFGGGDRRRSPVSFVQRGAVRWIPSPSLEVTILTISSSFESHFQLVCIRFASYYRGHELAGCEGVTTLWV